METLVNERGLSPRDAFQRFVAPPLRLVVRVKGGQDLSAPVDGEIGSDESGIWWRSGRSLLAVFASSRGRLVGLAIRNSDGVEIASKRSGRPSRCRSPGQSARSPWSQPR